MSGPLDRFARPCECVFLFLFCLVDLVLVGLDLRQLELHFLVRCGCMS